MTTLLAREARRNAVLFSGDHFSAVARPKFTFGKFAAPDGEADALIVTDVPVFRSGTFRDSMGIQHTWEPLHMDQMVAHFDLLRNRQIFADVPVRKGHGSFVGDPMDGLIGWHTALRVKELVNPIDSNTYSYLLADYAILDAPAMAKITSGLWKNRSAEVGSYITNAEAEFWPVYQGVAYVDIPAVEGLNVYTRNPGVGTVFSLMFENDKEVPVSGTTGAEGNPTQPTSNPPAQGQPAVVPVATPPVAPAQPVQPVATQPPVEAAPQGTGAESSPPAVQPSERRDEGDPANLHANAGSVLLFGRPAVSFAAIQAHIAALETFRTETLEAGRKGFVKKLADEQKIAATQVPQLEVFALALTDDQWTQYVASWNAAPTLPLLGLHGAGAPQAQQAHQEQLSELDTARAMVRQHQLAGMQQDVLQQTESYKKMVRLEAALQPAGQN